MTFSLCLCGSKRIPFALFSPRLPQHPTATLKSRRPLAGHVERFLQRHAGLAQGSLLKESADERHAVRHATRWRELRRRMRWIGRPVATRLRDFYEPRA